MIFSDFTQQKLLGHTGRCFDIRYSNDCTLLLSASEDGHALLWDLKTKKACGKFLHNRESEVLRATFLNTDSTLITTCGADGKAIIWKTNQTGGDEDGSSSNTEAKISKKCVLSHGSSQIYACESLDIDNDKSLLMTAADSVLYLWDYSHSDSLPVHTWTVSL
jgi:WD40 repeat protein